MTLQEQALHYYNTGLTPIPILLRSKRPPKGFHWKQFQSHRPTEIQVKTWFKADRQNIALICGTASQNLCVIDFDVKDGFKQFCDENPFVLKTPIVKSNRGYHIYLKLAFAIGSFPFKSGEILGNGHLVMTPPSIHPSGAQYTVINDITFDKILTLTSLPPLPLSATPIMPSSPAPISSSNWLVGALNGVCENHRNSTAAKLAGYLHKKKIPRDVIEQILLNWNRNNSPPLPEREIQITVASITRYPF